jgi:predicted dehydrogenase
MTKVDTSWLDLDYAPKRPTNLSRGIGMVGAGAIVESCHLPAYRMAGFNVVGITDIDMNKANKVATTFELKHTFATLEQLLAHPEIEVIDIAVPAQFQPGIVEQAVRAGKHVLCQKPLANSYAEARRIADAVQAAGVKGAVNQQMRWSPGIRASHSIVRRGWVGELTQASIQVNVLTDFAQWPWITKINRLEVMYHSIHYIDAIRYIVGQPPEYIYADGTKFPGQVSVGETRTLIHMKFPGYTRGLVHDNHNNISGQDDWCATYRFEGTKGVVKGTNGALYNYPVGREDTLQFTSNELVPGMWFTPTLEGRWFPHAFIGTMGELLRAIEENREPENSVQDNLYTMQTVFAAYRSMEENRPVTLQEIASEA